MWRGVTLHGNNPLFKFDTLLVSCNPKGRVRDPTL